MHDQPGLGRLVTETTTEHIEEVRCLIDGDPHLTIDEVQVETGISCRTVKRIISEELQLKKNYHSLGGQHIS